MELLQHPFICKFQLSSAPDILAPMIAMADEKIRVCGGREKALEDGTEESESSTSGSGGSGGSMIMKSESADESEEVIDYGTMQIVDDSDSDSGSVRKAGSKSKLAITPEIGLLRDRLDELDAKLERDLDTLRLRAKQDKDIIKEILARRSS